MVKPDSKTKFNLKESQGAVLVTKYHILQEDIEEMGTARDHIRNHHSDWVRFAKKYGDNLRVVLVTGVDRTRDWAMMAYSKKDDADYKATSDFHVTARDTPIAVWGEWNTNRAFIHTTSGPRRSEVSPPPTSGVL